MDDYGAARIAARRATLLSPDDLARLAAAESPDAMLLLLERHEEWRRAFRELGPLVMPAWSGIELAIERRRSAELAALPAFFEPPARELVEALVLPLDLERVLEVIRRRRAGADHEVIASTVGRGALLDDGAIGDLARASGPIAVVGILQAARILDREDAARLTRAWAGNGPSDADLERDLGAAFDAARLARCNRSAEGRTVAGYLEAERTERMAVAAALAETDAAAADAAHRAMAAARLDGLAHAMRRDPLGIGAAAGYVASVEAETIRLRAALAAVNGRWSRQRMAAWLGRSAA